MRRAKNDRLLGEGTGVPDSEAELRAELSAVEDQVEEQRFALEADLRDFLGRNLTVLEPGLRLYRDAERDGVEFSIDDGRGRIDLLALDARGLPVVIELKLSRGRNQTLGYGLETCAVTRPLDTLPAC